MPRPQSIGKSKGSSGSLFSRAITSLISIEGGDSAGSGEAAAREAEAVARASASAEACHVEEIFADSKFLVGHGGRPMGGWQGCGEACHTPFELVGMWRGMP